MEDHNDVTLKVFLGKNTMELRTFLSISLELAEMLGKLHQKGFVRQDLNPEYISIHPSSGRLTLQPLPQSNSVPVDERTATLEEERIQAFAYISPEQTGRMRRNIDACSDLYALGVLLYELLTGELPFQAKTAAEWIHAHLALLPIPPRTRKPEVPQVIHDLVLKLLSKTAENRYQCAYGLQDDLQKCLDQLKEKGIIEPFPLGEADERSRFRLPEKLYDREKELQALLAAYERSRSGSVELMVIGGHAGSGKTELMKAIQMPVMHKNGFFISSKFDPLKQSIPYAALILAFRDLVRQILAGADDQIAEWRKRLLAAVGQSGITLTEVISELTLIIGEQPPVKALPPVESTNRFHALFGNFIKAFADKKHSLVITLDDLQWADPASLQLLQVLIQDPSNRYLFIVGTYRLLEIHEGHVLEELFFGNLRKTGIAASFINVEALGLPNVIQYVADVLHADPSRIKPLAEAVYQKTGGNPFYVKQMLQFFYEEKLLYFNSDEMRWDWHMDAVKEREGFPDVISLIARRFAALPEETRQMLRFASCFGHSFDIRMLSELYEQETEVTEQDLLPALGEGLILAEQHTYTFLHDRVRKAAYDLIPDEEKKNVHLKIGRLLLRFFDSDATDDHLFEVVHHLNGCSELITDRAEIDQLARLNLRAGRKAKASAAYVSALELLKKGAQLIEMEGWSRHDALYFSLMLESSECQYFCGYFEQAEAVLEQLLLHTKHPTDRSRIYVIQITMYAFQKREGKACEIAVKAMAEMGLTISPKSSRLAMLTEIAKTQLQLATKRDLIKDLPMNRDPLHQALADIVMASSSILFIVNRELAVILFAKYVRMSLNQGHSEAFSIALGSYAITLAFGFKRYGAALRLAEIALSYSEKTDSILLKGKIQLIVALILQFLRPQELGPHFQKAGQLSLEGGDLVYAGYAISSHLIIAASEDLRHLNYLCKTYPEQAARALDGMTLRVLHQTMQYVHLMQNTTDSSPMTGDGVPSEGGRLPQEEITNDEHKGNRYFYVTCKLKVFYLNARYSEAVALAEDSKNLEAGATLLLTVKQRHCFYHALAIMADYRGATVPLRRRYRKTLVQLLARMEQWTKVVPESTLSKYRLMLAEWARLRDDPTKAAEFYDQAIRTAQEHGYPRDEAIANELAARYYFSVDKNKIAEAYLQNACAAYYKWGAFGKMKNLHERYPVLNKLPSLEKASVDVHNNPEKEIVVIDKGKERELDKELDMATLRQASEIGPRDREEGEWLESFLDLAIRNAGAEKGVVLLGMKGNVVAVAEKDMNRHPEKPVDHEERYSAGVVRFVMRTGESVVLGEACQSMFASDPYIQRTRPKSILCLPILYPDTRNGVLYLENNLTPASFTVDRLQVLEMVFSRMAYLKLWQSQQYHSDEAGKLVEPLTNREIDIVRLIAEGLSNKEIALRLNITEGTVKIHIVNLYGKLQVKRRVQAVSKARELQLLD